MVRQDVFLCNTNLAKVSSPDVSFRPCSSKYSRLLQFETLADIEIIARYKEVHTIKRDFRGGFNTAFSTVTYFCVRREIIPEQTNYGDS